MRLAPSVAATRVAVRHALLGVRPPSGLLVACSGGADSLALAAATAFVAPRLGLTAGLISVDHGLQDGSAERAKQVAEWGTAVGLSPSVAVGITVRHGAGPEADARAARYAALVDAARSAGAGIVLLGQTRDDQAETVLLALARGAGPRGLSGMPVRRNYDGVELVRPFLGLPRAQTRDACAAQRLSPWDDPHNADPAYARSRVRAALPSLVEALGPDVVANLARTARLLAADTELLDELASQAAIPLIDADGTLDAVRLAELPAALRTRVLRDYALSAGAQAAALATVHIDALDALVTAWRGQGPVALPGGLQVARVANRLVRTSNW